MAEQENEQKKRGGILWIIVALLLGSNIITLWLYWQEKNKAAEQIVVTEKVLVEKSTIQSDLMSLQKEYENLKTNDAALQKEIDEKKAYIEQLIKEAQKHKGDAYIISKLKKETETLRQIMIGYVHTIDSLGQLNQTLRVEKENVIKELDTEKGKITDLNKEKDELKATIQKGSILTCFNVKAIAVKTKSGGKKESIVDKAKRADRKEMAKNYDDNYKFNFDKSSGYFAGKETLNYANVEISGVLYCEGQEPLVPGNYIIEVTCDNVVVATTALKLN
jgi:hypothetical protein